MSDIEARPYSKDYEITDAMFGAFRSPGGARYFWKLFGWSTLLFSLVYLVAVPPIVRAYVALIGGAAGLENADAATAEEALESISASMFSMVPGLILLTIGSLAILAVVRSAFYRRYFHDEADGVFPFRLGADEWRQFLAQLGYWGLFIVFYFVLIFVIALIGGAAAGVSAAAGGDGASLAIIFLMMAALYIGMIVGAVWYGVKFAPAGALTGLRRKTHVLAAGKITRNRFWALFGSLFVAGIIGYVIYYALFLTGLFTGLSGLFSGGVFDQLMSDNPEAAIETMAAQTRTTGFRIGAIFAIIMTAAGQAFYLLILMGPSAFFVKQWNESDPREVFT